MRSRGGRTENVPLTEEAQELLGPRWADVPVFIPHPADEPRFEAEVTYWATWDPDDSLY